MFDHFNILAPIYEIFINAEPRDFLVELMELEEHHLMLDIGGGTGRISQFFAEKTDQIIIADLSIKMLHQSQDKPGLFAVNTHSEKIPFPSAVFDRILMVDALHHVCDQQITAEELWRVLKPGGKIIIEEPDIHRTVVKMVALAEKIALMRSHFLTLEEIKALFTPFHAEIRGYKEDYFVWAEIRKNS